VIDKLIRLIGTVTLLAVGPTAFPAEDGAGPQPPPDPPSRERIQQLLRDPNPHLRAYAVYNLGRHFPKDAAEITPLTSDKDAGVRRAAIFSLGLLQTDSQTDTFLQALKDLHYGVRRAAVFALGNLRSRRAMQGVVLALKDRDPMVRQLAILALARTGSKSLAPKIIPMLKDESPRVRRTAAFALGILRDRSALEPLKRLHRNRKRSQPSERMERANKSVQVTLKKKLNLSDKFLHFMETINMLSEASGVEIRVDDEILFRLNISATDPKNLDNIRLVMWNVPFETALGQVVRTINAYSYVESGIINISSNRYAAYDTPVALEVAGAMALLGDRKALSEIRKYSRDPRAGARARQLLREVTGR
jgi:HEAT repeat protein